MSAKFVIKITDTYIFVGKLVVKHLPLYHCLQPTSFTKFVIYGALSLLYKPLLSAYYMPDTRELER